MATVFSLPKLFFIRSIYLVCIVIFSYRNLKMLLESSVKQWQEQKVLLHLISNVIDAEIQKNITMNILELAKVFYSVSST